MLFLFVCLFVCLLNVYDINDLARMIVRFDCVLQIDACRTRERRFCATTAVTATATGTNGGMSRR